MHYCIHHLQECHRNLQIWWNHWGYIEKHYCCHKNNHSQSSMMLRTSHRRYQSMKIWVKRIRDLQRLKKILTILTSPGPKPFIFFNPFSVWVKEKITTHCHDHHCSQICKLFCFNFPHCKKHQWSDICQSTFWYQQRHRQTCQCQKIVEYSSSILECTL